jgi:hypothetical protein
LQQVAVREFQATIPLPAQAYGAEVEHVQDWTMRLLAERAVEAVKDLVHQMQQRTADLLQEWQRPQQVQQRDQAQVFWERTREARQEAQESREEQQSQQEQQGRTMRP